MEVEPTNGEPTNWEARLAGSLPIARISSPNIFIRLPVPDVVLAHQLIEGSCHGVHLVIMLARWELPKFFNEG